MRKLYVGLLLSLGWCLVANAAPAGRYVANEDLKVEVLMGRTVAGTMLLKKGRQFQVTGAEGEFIQIELGQELKGRLPRIAETKIALAAAETHQVPNPVTNVDNARPPQPENPAEASPPKPAGALAIKGVYIGMDAAEAVRVLNAHLPDKIESPTHIPETRLLFITSGITASATPATLLTGVTAERSTQT